MGRAAHQQELALTAYCPSFASQDIQNYVTRRDPRRPPAGKPLTLT
jgi:hypothetical protein